MAEGKSYRFGLMVAGLAVIAVGLFIMVEEKPHVYGTMCALGVLMLCVGMVWSFCQCYPKVVLVSGLQEKKTEEVECISDKQESLDEPLPVFLGLKCESSRHPPHSHSCPTLHHLV
ncbi:hypothetical protein WMY93_025119 [Mugilogobius chulae]|uniref:Barttin n=1 Tax=Mugilogobius chulae TaxID=88201 RepID=A0AAW0NDK3_9GOBI